MTNTNNAAIDTIINEILRLEAQRDERFEQGDDEVAWMLDEEIVNMIFDQLKDEMHFERYLQLKSERNPADTVCIWE